MLTGKTYTVNGNVTINPKDTLLLQEGVTVNITGPYFFVVKGTMISLGSKGKQNYFTATSAGAYKCDVKPGSSHGSCAPWSLGGIYCDSSCTSLILKWTHIEYAGAAVKTPSVKGDKAGNAYSMYFVNPNGNFIMEDSWLYGGLMIRSASRVEK